MNRKQRRTHHVEDLPRADVNLRNLTPVAYAPARRGTRSFGVVARSDFELWAQIVMETLKALGITQPSHIIGLLLDFLNTQPVETRKILATGIIDGLGLSLLQKPGDEGEIVLEVKLDPLYEPLVRRKAERPGGLWVPGDDMPGSPVLQ